MVLQVTSRIDSSFKNYEKVVFPKPRGYSPPLGMKKMCDGVGGLVKHQATLHNLRDIPENAIQTVKCMVSTLSQKLKAMNLTPLGMDTVVEFRERKNEE